MIISHPDKHVTQALAVLEANKEFSAVKDWLRTELAQIREYNDIQRDIIALRHTQGAAQALNDFLMYADQARVTLRDMT